MSKIDYERIHYAQTRASDKELDKLKEVTGERTNEDAVREAILRTIKGE